MMTAAYPKWRLRLVSIVATAIVCVLFYRIIQIQIVRHERYRECAIKQWHRKVKWPARRGSIYDRNGYPISVSHKKYTVGVTPRDFPSDPAAAEMLSRILGLKASRIRSILKRDSSYIRLARDVSLTGEEEARLSSLSGIKIDSRVERLNPLGSVTPRFIGSIDREGAGTGGIESMFDGYLRGEDGWLLVNRDARDQAYRPMNAPGKNPLDGNDIYLTIDSGIQSIVDFELEQALGKYGAVRGVAIVIDPANGDIIALSEKETAGCGDSFSHDKALFSSSCIYEPGSTFKLVTDAFLLEKGSVGPYDVFYGEKGEAEFDFGRFTDDHPREWLTFKESFVYSSNICTIKAVKDADRKEFYEYLLKMGFGGRTGVNLPAESKGRLREPGEWSGRSLASVSIGQEIGVTALQMAMVYSALANGGQLLVPRVALKVESTKGEMLEDYPVIPVRRIFSTETARMMADFCRDVVREGTGTYAAVEGIEVAGKTGTAQKSDGHRYLPDKFVASFIGFAPFREPRLVCLVILDEPEYRYHYGGSSSAVVFRRIMEGINLSTDLLVSNETSTVAFGRDNRGKKPVPCFLRLRAAEAEDLAGENRLNLSYTSGDGEVYAQIPGPGTLIEPGGEVILSFRDNGSKQIDVAVPDLRGLPIRRARRMLLECGLKSDINGYGVVINQDPLPGNVLRQGGRVLLRCRPGRGKRRDDFAAGSLQRGDNDGKLADRSN